MSLSWQEQRSPPPTPPQGRGAKIVQNPMKATFILFIILLVFILFLFYNSTDLLLLVSLSNLPSLGEGQGVGF
jgi:hypothetical protein